MYHSKLAPARIRQGFLSEFFDTPEVRMNYVVGCVFHNEKWLAKRNGKWQASTDSRYNRRITANTPMLLSGPVAGHERVKTPQDHSGFQVKGTIHNCSGGVTPWGTVLSCEENINHYFYGETQGMPQEADYNSYRIGRTDGYQWHKIDNRFNLSICIYRRICMCTHTLVYIYTYTHMYTYTYLNLHIYIQIYI